MRGDTSGRRPTAAERERFEAAIVGETTPGYVTVRALIALGGESTERLARSTAMGREFVAGVRRRVAAGQSAGLLTDRPSTAERVLETATGLIVAAGRCELAIGSVSAALGMPRRTLYRVYSANKLVEACQRRAMTIWRSWFARRIERAKVNHVERLFVAVDTIADWAGSERFYGDQVLWPALCRDARGDELREHTAAIDRFATELARRADVADAHAFGIFVATSVIGAAAWIDDREKAHALATAFVERATGTARLG
jgi:AcrR family transcriptional regulator